METNILNRISAQVQARVAQRKQSLSESVLRQHCNQARVPHPFKAAFDTPSFNIIAEVKFGSPRSGYFAAAAALSPTDVALEYIANGAAALSVLTEADNFYGAMRNLVEIRSEFPAARILMKDFITDEYQLLEALHYGADAVLLIISLLGESRARELMMAARALKLSVLVEVHDETELAMAQSLGADLIGINNRNLKTMEISLEVSKALIAAAPVGATLISESGINTHADLVGLRALGFNGFLVGSSLMKTGQPGVKLRQLLMSSEERRA